MENQCKDFHKKLDNNIESGYPIQLYHATPSINEVCELGLKPRCEIDKSCGLDGGTDKLISFTTDKNLAKIIANELEISIKIANNELEWDNIDETIAYQSFSNSKTDKDIIKSLNITEKNRNRGKWLWNEVVNKARHLPSSIEFTSKTLPKNEDEWEEFKEGWIEVGNTVNPINSETLDELKSHEQNPSQVKCKDKSFQHGLKKTYCHLPNQRQKTLWDIYRMDYLKQRTRYGGDFNPLFFGTNFWNFQDKDSSNVGVVEVTAYLPKPLTHYGKNKNQLKTNIEIEKEAIENGFWVMEGMNEIRLTSNRFNQLKII